MEPTKNGNYFQRSNSGSDISNGTGMEVDSVGTANGNGAWSANGSSETPMRFVQEAGNHPNHGQDNVDIVIPPSVPSIRSGISQERQTGEVDNESDSRNFLASIFKKLANARSGSDVMPAAPCVVDDLFYNMEHPNRGKCVIFNHSKFDKRQQLPERAGSDMDVQKIGSTFSKLGFTVIELKDYKFERIVHTLRSIAQEDHSQNDCLAIFVLSHGQANELYAYDIAYKPSTLWDMFTANKCSTLAGKPKMFFINACRGEQFDDGTEVRYSRTEVDGPGDQTYRIPNQADFLTVFSTFEVSNDNVDLLKRAMRYMSLGYYSWRNNKSGSCFIQALCTVFSDASPYKDVVSMMTLVNRVVATTYESRSKDENQNKKKQVPHVCHTLMRDIYLSPKHRSTLV